MGNLNVEAIQHLLNYIKVVQPCNNYNKAGNFVNPFQTCYMLYIVIPYGKHQHHRKSILQMLVPISQYQNYGWNQISSILLYSVYNYTEQKGANNKFVWMTSL